MDDTSEDSLVLALGGKLIHTVNDVLTISDGIDTYKNAGVNYLVFQILSSDLEGVIGTMRTFSKEVIIKSESFSNISKA